MLAATAAVLYALAARVWPASIGETEISNRIGQPFQYWNAVGTTAALAVPGLLWLGARRGAGSLGRVLAYPALGAAILALLLTQSRGALLAAVDRHDRVAAHRAAAAAQPAGDRAAVDRRRRGGSLGAVQGRVLRGRRAAAREGGGGRATSGCCSC